MNPQGLLQKLRAALQGRMQRQRQKASPAVTASTAPDSVSSEVHNGHHGSVLRHDPYAFQIAHRRLAWMLRLSAGINVALALCVCLLAVGMGELLPLKEVRLALVRMDPTEERIVRIEPIHQSIQGFDKLAEQVSARVVRLLLEIDGISQDGRLNEVRPYLDDGYAKQFSFAREDTIKEQIKDGLVRSILIESSTVSERVGNLWRVTVDFVQADEIGDQRSRRPLRAYLKITTQPQTVVATGASYENPLGLKVLGMVVKQRQVAPTQRPTQRGAQING